MLDDYAVIRPPDMSRERFCEILAAAASPAQAECGAMYDAIVDQGVSPAFALALFRQESSFGRAGITPAFDTRGIGNVRTPQDPANGGEIITTPRGNFVKYPSWTAGARDWAQRIRGERYAGAGLDSVATIIPTYAPAGDQDNVPSAYIDSVLRFIAREREGEAVAPLGDLIDIRADLARNPDGGPQETAPAADKTWAVVHYNGPAVDQGRDPLTYFKAIAHFHAFQRNWGTATTPQAGDGIMYHIGVSPDGRRWLLRDLDDVLWHCGAAQNRTGIGVHAMLGGSQRASAAMLLGLRRVVDDLVAVSVARSQVIGHVELGTTGVCPGTLQADFVVPYRAGGHASTDALLDREYARCGGAAMLGEHVVKARLTWTVDWGAIDADVLICGRGVVSVAPAQTDTAQRMFTDQARGTLEAAGVLIPY